MLTVSVTAGPSASAATAGTALALNGTDQYVTFGPAPALGARAFTLEIWFKRTGIGSTASTGTGGVAAVPLLTKGRGESDASSADANYFLGIDGTSGKLVADMEEGQSTASGASPGLNHPVRGDTVVTYNVWHHAAATYDGKTWHLYLDGTRDGTATLSAPRDPRYDSIQHAGVGTAMSSTGERAGHFAGVVDEARVWNVARSQADITGTKNLEVASSTGLIGRWGLNDGTGTVAANSVTSSPGGTVLNGATWSSYDAFGSDTTPPAAPTALSARSGDGVVSLSWTPPDNQDVAGYRVYRSTSSPVRAVAPASGDPLVPGPAYTGEAQNGETYFYAVTAVDYYGNESMMSPEVSATPTAAPATAGTALALNGTDQYVTFGPAPALGARAFTLEIWFKRTGIGSTASTGTGGVAAVPLLTKGRGESDASSADANYFLGIDGTSGKLVADMEEGQSTASGASPGLNHPVRGDTVVTYNVWHHAAATYDGKTWHLYLDGTRDGTATLSAPRDPRYDSIQHAGVGTAMSSTGERAGHFAGVVDEARVWNVARSQADITGTKNLEVASSTGLIGRWGLNDGTGTVAANSVTSSPGGTVLNDATWSSYDAFGSDTTPPAAPTALSARSGDGVVSLSWTPPDNQDVAGYRVYRSTSSPVRAVAPASGDPLVPGPAYTGEAQNGETYFYAVTAVDYYGNESMMSPEVSATPTADPDAVVMVGAGDIAECSGTAPNQTPSVGPMQTADLLDTMPNPPVFTLGDNVQEDGAASEYSNCYEPTWGRAKNRTRPAAGNHEYMTGAGANYYSYFGAAAGDPGKGYYGYDAGPHWRVVVLNSECAYVSCAVGSPQERWLRAELTAHAGKNVLAMEHKPRFTSGPGGDHPEIQPLWEALYEYGADLILTGHDHVYERQAPLDPSGQRDDRYGIRQITVGTGGARLESWAKVRSTSEVRDNTTWGVLRLALHSGSYDWKFLPVAGKSFTDFGSTLTHGAPGDKPPVVDTVTIDNQEPSTNDVLSAVVSGHDPDGEAVTFSYRWLRNGVAIDGATGASLDLAEPGHGGKGDDIEVVVTPTDPRATGAPLRSAPVTVVNSVPVVDTVTIDNSTPRTQDVLTARATSLDADGDAVTYAYQWRVSGTDVRGATDSTFDLGPAGHGDKGDRVAVRVVAADTSSQSAPATSADVTVGNTPPVLPPIPDQTSTAGNTVSLSKVASDADGDALYYSATGLPTGLSIDAGTGLISGTAGNDFGPHLWSSPSPTAPTSTAASSTGQCSRGTSRRWWTLSRLTTRSRRQTTCSARL